MLLATDNALLAQIQAAAAASYPHEACGLVVSVGKKPKFIECENIDGDPRNFFTISAVDYVKARKEGEIVAVWHSHCEIAPKPSEKDIAGCNNGGVPWIIIGIKKTEAGFIFEGPTIIEPDDTPVDYIGRPYFYGIYDCYSLVQDYYRREHGIVLRDYPRIDQWWHKGYDFFSESFKQEGFVKLIDVEPRKGDVFLMQIEAEVVNHVAIYLGDDMMLHHQHKRLSRRDVYGGHWAKHTIHHVRHATLC